MLRHDISAPNTRRVRELRTRHGFLIGVGEVVSRLKSRDLLAERGRVKKKTVRFTPADKLVQGLLDILCGCRHMRDLVFEAKLRRGRGGRYGLRAARANRP